MIRLPTPPYLNLIKYVPIVGQRHTERILARVQLELVAKFAILWVHRKEGRYAQHRLERFLQPLLVLVVVALAVLLMFVFRVADVLLVEIGILCTGEIAF